MEDDRDLAAKKGKPAERVKRWSGCKGTWVEEGKEGESGKWARKAFCQTGRGRVAEAELGGKGETKDQRQKGASPPIVNIKLHYGGSIRTRLRCPGTLQVLLVRWWQSGDGCTEEALSV